MNDREQLELAAKAAGYRWRGFSAFGNPLLEEDACKPEPRPRCPVVWNPLADGDDALRLAVKLSLTIYQWPGEICVCNEKGTVNEVVERVGDIYAATRRAIVRAAAEIGRKMQEGGAA